MAKILDGRALAKTLENDLRMRVWAITDHLGQQPCLATVLVGDDPASATYVRMKINACARAGIKAMPVKLSTDTDTETLLRHIAELNSNPLVFGILLQHPVPGHIDERRCFDAIEVAKDVDGVGCLGFGRMAMGLPAWGSATATGIMQLLTHYQIPIRGKRAVVVGRSPILGKPMAMMLLNADATVTVCHSKSRDLAAEVQNAEILVAALGKPRFIKPHWLKPGAVVIDAGYHPERCGDIDQEGIDALASAYTPVPGGVGPMTINSLIAQTVFAAEQSVQKEQRDRS